MEDTDAEQNEIEKSPARSKIILPLIVGLTICLVIGFFTLGYLSLTTPPPQTDDYSTLNEKDQQEGINSHISRCLSKPISILSSPM